MIYEAGLRTGDLAQTIKNWLGIGGGAQADVVTVAIAQDLRMPPYTVRRRFVHVLTQTAGAANTGYVTLYGQGAYDIVVDYVAVCCTAASIWNLYALTDADFGKRNGFAGATDSDIIRDSANIGMDTAAQTAENIGTASNAQRQIDCKHVLASTVLRLDGALPFTIRKARLNSQNDRGGIAVAPSANNLTSTVVIGGFFDP